MFGWLFNSFVTPSQLREKGVLGMNGRNYNFISKCNKRSLYPLVDNKVITKKLAHEYGVNTPKLIGIIEYQHQAKNLMKMIGEYKEFVIKPAQGSGGRGILVVVSHNGEIFTTASGRTLTYNEVYQHISNILSGLYSLGGRYDDVVIEELVHFSDIFSNFSYQGVPDVRIIVYKGFPAMTMMRLATKMSGGRANLHQGAVGVGLDISTGKALNAVLRDCPVKEHPDTKANLMDLKVPLWREHLEIGSKAYEMTGLGYIGADIVLDRDKGPMMLELNARPGLAIQIANGFGLQKVLKNIDKNYPQNLNAQERVDFVLGKIKL